MKPSMCVLVPPSYFRVAYHLVWSSQGRFWSTLMLKLVTHTNKQNSQVQIIITGAAITAITIRSALASRLITNQQIVSFTGVLSNSCAENFAKFPGKHYRQRHLVFKTLPPSQMFRLKKMYVLLVLSCEFCIICQSSLFSRAPPGRSSHWRCSMKRAALKNFAIFTGKHLCWSLFLMQPATLLKRDSDTGVF